MIFPSAPKVVANIQHTLNATEELKSILASNSDNGNLSEKDVKSGVRELLLQRLGKYVAKSIRANEVNLYLANENGTKIKKYANEEEDADM